MHDCRFMDIKVGYLFQYKGRMCRKTSTNAFRFCHPLDQVLNGGDHAYTADDYEPVKLYLAENGLTMNGQFVVPI